MFKVDFMRGKKNYDLAQVKHREMYCSDKNLSEEQKKELYSIYFKFFKKAAYQGHVEALYDMGQQYEDIGYLGLPNPNYNPKLSIYWYTKACKHEHAEACNNLSGYYENGIGCKINLQHALELLKKSADLGSTYGKRNYKLMLKQLTQD